MALQLTRNTKGIDANYWKITASNYSVFGNTTNVTLSLYVSKDARNAGLNNFLETETFSFEGFLTQAEMYAKIKESRTGKSVVTPAVTEGSALDGTFKVITPEVTVECETNPFALAIDC